jgi:hypothetical protein
MPILVLPMTRSAFFYPSSSVISKNTPTRKLFEIPRWHGPEKAFSNVGPTGRRPANPNLKQKIFGLNPLIGISIELFLKEQILQHHGKPSKIDLADAKYDELHNYHFSRSHGAIPIIDYNPRNEN